jgi:hypothetical protein
MSSTVQTEQATLVKFEDQDRQRGLHGTAIFSPPRGPPVNFWLRRSKAVGERFREAFVVADENGRMLDTILLAAG